jgi:hypothetical protein
MLQLINSEKYELVPLKLKIRFLSTPKKKEKKEKKDSDFVDTSF